MKQSKHFLLRPSTQPTQLPKSTSKASSIHHPLCSHLRTHQTLAEAGQHQSLPFSVRSLVGSTALGGCPQTERS